MCIRGAPQTKRCTSNYVRDSITSDGKNSINETPKQGQEQWEELYLWYIQVNYKLKD